MFKKFARFKKEEKIILVFTLLLTAVILVLIYIAVPFVSNFIQTFTARSVRPFAKETVKIQQSFENELNYLSTQAQELAESEELIKYIKERDILNAVSFIDDEVKRRNLSGMIIVDKDGVVLSREYAISQRGDYIFNTTPWGRLVAQGEKVVTIESGGTDPLDLIAGQPLMKEGEMVGGIFAAFLPYNEYAVSFQDKYLRKGAQIAFYSRESGIMGSSFQNDKIEEMLDSYFNLGSRWILEGDSDEKVRMNGNIYFVKNIVFPGINESPGGAFIFYPINHSTQSLLVALTATILFIVLIILFALCYPSIKKKFSVRSYLVSSIYCLIVFFFTFLITRIDLDGRIIRIKEVPYLIYNSTLELAPAVSTFSKEFEQTVAIEIVTGGEAINVAQVVINYNPAFIQVNNIITRNSFCSQDLFLEKSFDNENGQVRIVCGLPTPGFQGRGTIAELALQPLANGDFYLNFDKETQILANDGLGTNVLRLATDGSYHVASSESKILDSGLPEILIFSSTHSNSRRWYNKKSVSFSWPDYKVSKYLYAFDQSPNTIPTGELVTTNNFIDIDVEKDGLYYFHVAPQKNKEIGQPTHFKVMVDTQAPSLPAIKVSDKSISPGEIVRIEFKGEDKLSGLQNSAYLSFNSIFLPLASPIFVPFMEKGTYGITIRVFDKAGNYSDASVDIEVK